MAEVTIKTIYMIESGKVNPSLQTLEKIMAVLGLELVARIKQTDETLMYNFSNREILIGVPFDKKIVRHRQTNENING